MARRRHNAPKKSSGVPKWVIYGGIGIAAFWLLTRGTANASTIKPVTYNPNAIDPLTGRPYGQTRPLTGQQSLIMGGMQLAGGLLGKLFGSSGNVPKSVANPSGGAVTQPTQSADTDWTKMYGADYFKQTVIPNIWDTFEGSSTDLANVVSGIGIDSGGDQALADAASMAWYGQLGNYFG